MVQEGMEVVVLEDDPARLLTGLEDAEKTLEKDIEKVVVVIQVIHVASL